MESPSPTRSPTGTSSNDAPPPSAQMVRHSRPRKRPVSFHDKKPGGQAQAFFFVNSGSSTREKRAHVMRHHIQEKRKQHLLGSQADRQANRSPRYLPWRKKLGQEDQAALAGGMRRSLGYPWANDGLAPQVGPPCATHPTSDYQHALPYVPGPVTMLSAVRQDPFESLPIHLDRNGHELVDDWSSKLTYWSGKNQHIKNIIFRASMSHPITFQAVILCYCARWRANINKVRDDPQVTLHLGQTEQAVADPVNTVPRIDVDSLIMALTGLSLQEERYGSLNQAEEYINRATQLLRPLAGSNRAVEIFLLYVRYLMAPRVAEIPPDGAQWLIAFVHSADTLMVQHNTPYFLALVPQRSTVFQFESPLHMILSSGPHPSQVPNDDRMYVVQSAPTSETWRTAALIYVTTTLWDFQHSPSKTARFLDHLLTVVRENNLDRYHACESLVWMLLEEGYEADMRDSERGWSTCELLRIHKLLGPDLQFKFNEILLSFLMLNPPIGGMDTFEKEMLDSDLWGCDSPAQL